MIFITLFLTISPRVRTIRRLCGYKIQYQNHEWLPAKQFAKGVGVGLSTVYKWAEEGKLVTAKLGGLKLIRLDMDLTSFRTLLGRIVSRANGARSQS